MKRLALLLGLVLASTAGAASTADPGVTAKRILLGGTVPLSGEASAFGSVGPGAKAYFDYVNAQGGVHGRRIEYRFLDDAYDPSKTVQQTRKLVEQDRVFAIFNSVGTANNAAIQPYLNSRKVPQLFVGDGSQGVSRPGKYPWTIGFLQSYVGEGAIYGRHLARTRKTAKIAVLYENTPLGKEMTLGLERWIRGKGPQVVEKASYELLDTDVSTQVARLKASGADTLMLFATPKFAIQGFSAAHRLAWKPQVYVASISIEPGIMAIARLNAPELTKGAVSIAFVKNPNDPIWARDPALRLYRHDHAAAPAARQAQRRLQLVRDDRRVDDGGDPAPGGAEPHPRGRAQSRTESLPAAESVPAARHRLENVENELLPARSRLPLPLRQPPVGESEFAPRRPRVASPRHRRILLGGHLK